MFHLKRLSQNGQRVYNAHKTAITEQLPMLRNNTCALGIALMLQQFCEKLPCWAVIGDMSWKSTQQTRDHTRLDLVIQPLCAGPQIAWGETRRCNPHL